MVKRIGGIRRKTRYKFRKGRRNKGKISLTRYFQRFNLGDTVHLSVEPSVHSGMYHPNFMGRTGIVRAKRGVCYEIVIDDLGKKKTLIVHPVHLRRV